MTRFSEAKEQLRDRLRATAGVVATISRGGADLAVGVTIVPIDVLRAIRSESEYQLEDDDRAWLVGVDDLAGDPAVGDLIVVGTTEHRVTQRPELETCWRWHDTSEIQRVIFTKQWGAV